MRARRAKASPQSRGAAGARTASGEVNAPAAPATVVKMPAATRTAHAGPADDTRDELSDAHGGRDDGVVRPPPLEPGLHGIRGHARRGLHRRGRDQRRRDELEVGEPAEVRVVLVDERAEQQADPDEEEHRVDERDRDRSAPHPPVAVGVPADDRDDATRALFDEAPAGEGEEDVLERASPHE